MTDSVRTIAESMAIAVLKGDYVAAYALADRLIEESHDDQNKRALREIGVREQSIADDGFSVCQWPEFRAFARRLGFMYNLHAIGAVITIKSGEMVTIQHSYAGSDIPPGDT
jgi:hypothetical protein